MNALMLTQRSTSLRKGRIFPLGLQVLVLDLITESPVCKRLQARRVLIACVDIERGASFLEVEGFEEKEAQGG